MKHLVFATKKKTATTKYTTMFCDDEQNDSSTRTEQNKTRPIEKKTIYSDILAALPLTMHMCVIINCLCM